ncbi:MAG: carboxypeptidase M32 [Waddliaceae bacterium]
MNQAQKDYEALCRVSIHCKTLQGVQQLLHWDQETYMPPKGVGIRTEQLKILSGIIHREKTGRRFGSALKKLVDVKTGALMQEGLTLPQQAALREWRRDYLRDTQLPRTFVEKFSKLASESLYAWEHAKNNEDFQSFLPFLEKIVYMCRKKADLIGYQDHPYDPLLDAYEPEMTTKEIHTLFHPLKTFVLQLLKTIRSAKQVDDHFLKVPVSVAKQFSFGKRLLSLISHSLECCRLDVSAHPFCSSSHPTDNRFTTHLVLKDPMTNIFSILHECGHAFYDMGVPEEHYGSPLGEPISFGIHESQSRWWETLIGRSKPFWELLLPIMKKHFKGKFDSIPLDAFWKAINRVEPSLVRVEADEVTYSLHVILRFELELALIEGTLAPKEVPEAWNENMRQLLGVVPTNHSQGCLQDPHWSLGDFGYFPTYTLGNLYASHLFEEFEKTFPGWEQLIAKGTLTFLKEWLSQEVYQHGRRYTGKELLKKVSGRPVSIKAFTSYLQAKYASIYNL